MPWQNAIPVVSKDRAGILTPNGDFHVVDGNTEAIERSTTGLSTFTADVMPDGMLVVQGAIMTRTTIVSTNGGKTWTDLNTNRFVHAVTFADSRTTYAIGPVDPGLFAGAYALMVSRDGAKTWKKSGKVPGGLPVSVRTLFFDRSEKALYAFLQNGQILRSVDEGKSWTRSL